MKDLIVGKYNTYKRAQPRIINEYAGQFKNIVSSNMEDNNGSIGNINMTGRGNMSQHVPTIKTS